MRHKPKFKIGDHVHRRLSGEKVNQFIIKSGYITAVSEYDYIILDDDRSLDDHINVVLLSTIEGTDEVYVLYDSPEAVWARI